MVKAGHAGPVQTPEQHTRLSLGLHASQAEHSIASKQLRAGKWSFVLGLLSWPLLLEGSHHERSLSIQKMVMGSKEMSLAMCGNEKEDGISTNPGSPKAGPAAHSLAMV